MTDFAKNNLGKASSPYLKQHKDNPIHWQEWTKETLEYAKKEGKLILVSIGYSTCHWCHEMAEGAFSDKDVAAALNENFISIKIDREQRPDLDHYFMDFAFRTIGGGGWPLNVLLSPDGDPFFVGTYFPVDGKPGLPGFQDVLRQVQAWYDEHKNDVSEFKMVPPETGEVEEKKMIEAILDSFDEEWGGIGLTNKFPPHCTLLFLMSYYEANPSERLRDLVMQTLDAMAEKGLHDEKKGGFYRYCVDRDWTNPHYEKMLYDQAMHLWVYSVAYKLFGKDSYKKTVDDIFKFLKKDLGDGGLFYSAINGEESFLDEKKLTSWNALAGVGLLMAARYCGAKGAEKAARKVFETLIEEHFVKGKFAHSSISGKRQGEGFLEDLATVLLLATYLYEENFEGEDFVKELLEKLEKFKKKGKWIMGPKSKDFGEVIAPDYDHPIPSPVSLAEFARYRAQELLEQKEIGEKDPTFTPALRSDFHNYFTFLKTGNDHVLHVPEKIDWKEIPVNSMQFKGALHLDCYKKMCKMYKTKEELLKSF